MSSVACHAEREELNRLLVQIGRNDQKAFAELYKRTSSKLFGVCLRILRNPSDAQEVLQEAYVTVWRSAAGFDAGKAGAITWLVMLARNKAIDRLRERRRELPVDPFGLDGVVDAQPSPAAGAEAHQEYRRLEKCLNMLEPQQQHSLRDAFFSGATYLELAVRFKVPLGTMKSRMRRSLMQLRVNLDHMDASPEKCA